MAYRNSGLSPHELAYPEIVGPAGILTAAEASGYY